MLVKNNLKSETIESLSHKLSQLDTNIFIMYGNMMAYSDSTDAKMTSSSNRITYENSSFKLSLNGTFNSYNLKITSIKFLDKQTKTEVEIKGSINYISSETKFTSASITSMIDGEKITLKQTFEDFSIDPYNNYNVNISGIKWIIIDGDGGTLEIDLGDINFNEYGYFDSWDLKDIILDIDPSYDFTQTTIVSHSDMKFAVMDESNNVIKITTNNISEFETDSNGNLIINGFAGNDKISGTSGDDYIDGGVGSDIMNGGMGDDTYIIDNIKDMVKEAANQGNDTIIYENLKEFSLAKLPNVENLIYEGAEYSFLTGNKLDNILIGGDGENDLLGGFGNDILTGGAGRDFFIFNTKLSSSNVDIITDFVSGEDIITLNPKLFKKLAKSFTEDNFVYGDKALDSNDYLIFNTENNTLYYDVDGSATKASALEIVVVGSMMEFKDIEIG